MSTAVTTDTKSGALGSLLGRARSKVLASNITVAKVQPTSPTLLRVSADVPFAIGAGAHVALRVDGVGRTPLGTWRRYTIASVATTPTGCRVEWVAFLPDQGPASAWLRELHAGSDVSMRAVESPEPIPAEWSRILCVGDETSLGTFEALRTRVGRAVVVEAVLQTRSADDAVVAGVDRAAIAHVPAEASPMLTSSSALTAAVAERLHPTCALVVVGRRSTVNALRVLTNERGISKAQRLLRPYWAEGRAGLE